MVEIACPQQDGVQYGQGQKPRVDSARPSTIEQDRGGQIGPENELRMFPEAFVDGGKQGGDRSGKPLIDEVENSTGHHGCQTGQD